MTAPEAWLRRQAERSPDAAAIICQGQSRSFADLDRQTDGVALALKNAGVRRGQAFGCVSERTGLIGILSLAAPRTGAALLPVNPRLPAPQIAALFAKAGVTAAACDRRDLWPELSITLDAAMLENPVDRPAAPDSVPVPAPADAIHLIIATSGSTGEPKGAMLSGANLAAAVQGSRQRLPIDPGDVWLGCLPLYHIGGLSVLFRCLEAGATMLLHRGFDAAAVAADLAQGNATHISLVPAMLAQLLDIGCAPSPRLRWALIGGAALPAALAERAIAAGWPICPSYGMSEAGSQVTTCIQAKEWRPGLAGEPLSGITVGTAPNGRIRVRGPQVMAGYVNPTLTPGSGLDRDGWFETNDLGGLDADGRLHVVGRADDLLISGGENIAPSTVEDLAGHCPGVKAVAIGGRRDPTWGDLLVAIVVGDIEGDRFLAWCRQNLPSHLRPRAMVPVDALPLTTGGKLDRAAVRKLAEMSHL
ncbi:class I adenylate-forming enzyme family protein [Telmatospirillum sp.]|uniref:class I adenylate-forming enzyme family protein n=1 Tax=Telmatospirillum sp. TaxID=2079197 RepID=UPI00283FB795|nr:class I adenylate-forming enzyme family protein [Telmatospirillum sp.]MDR3439497.1 class I adenylate-forming enzyme family protein [Telmatospirillum sp.]